MLTLHNEFKSESNTRKVNWAAANLIDSVTVQFWDAFLTLCLGSMQSIFSMNSHIGNNRHIMFIWLTLTSMNIKSNNSDALTATSSYSKFLPREGRTNPQLVLTTTTTAGTKLYKTENSRGPALDFVHPALMASSPYVWIRRGPCGRN